MRRPEPSSQDPEGFGLMVYPQTRAERLKCYAYVATFVLCPALPAS